jgi:hypothetical protein
LAYTSMGDGNQDELSLVPFPDKDHLT